MKCASTWLGSWILSGLLGTSVALAGDIQEVEAVGIIGLKADAVVNNSVREAAVHNALAEMVEGIAMELLRQEGDLRPNDVEEELDLAGIADPRGVDDWLEGGESPGGSDLGAGDDRAGILDRETFGREQPTPRSYPPMVSREFLKKVLSKDPFEFVTRLQVIEDRGERPALFSSDPEVESEYVVVVQASIDRERIRERMIGAGVTLDSSRDSRRLRVHLALLGLEHYEDYQTIRKLLTEEFGIRSVIPVEIEPGRMMLELDASQNPEEFIEPLRKALPEHLDLIPVNIEEYAATLQVKILDPDNPEPTAPVSAPIDMPNPNRY